jgi:primosomal protein N' (replication factor Y) (superfamily II helicase)
VEVLLPRPFACGFDYRVPEHMQLRAGDYVQVPFGARELLGVVWGAGTSAVAEDKCKFILNAYPELPLMPQALRALIEWCAAYTLSPKGMVLKMAISVPEAITAQPASARAYGLLHVEAAALTPARKRVIEALQAVTPQPLTREQLMQQSGASAAVLAGMLKAGMLEEMAVPIAPMQPALHAETATQLRPEQQHVADAVKAQLNAGFQVIALEGVTGSGKTEVYFDVIAHLLCEDSQGQILVLLPEIVLTTQWMQRFETRFGASAGLWHSSVPASKRKRLWRAVAQGQQRIVVGARSALFLPFAKLRLLVVDEEHEPSYKQEEGVLYQARDMAVARAKQEGASALLCSATLSLETQHNCAQGKYQLLQLRERHGEFAEPQPQLIDLRAHPLLSGRFISAPLQDAMQEALGAGHQAMLYLNRRGYSPLLLCRSCGHRFQCPNCSAWMVQHLKPPRLHCHHCDWTQSLPTCCPECDGEDLAPCGPGVERIAEEAALLFPDARILTLSSDAKDLPAQLERIMAGEADILIGTQMIAKGHDFPNLAVVGVIDGDVGLEGGDIRAAERCYQLLHQLAGRAGRGKVAGKMLLQTTQPDHALMQALAAQDRVGFMQAQLQMRELGGWPPFGRLANLLFDGFDEQAVQRAAQSLLRAAPAYDGVRYLGPAPAPVARVRNRYRYQMLVKAPKQTNLSQLMQEWLARCPLPASVRLRVDIDPYHFG